MAKYNEDDILEITEDFVLECAAFSEGEKYSVVEVEGSFYSLESDEYYFVNSISEVDAHPGFRKVEPKVEHMELGKTYKSQGNDLYYRPTEFDFVGGKVLFDYSSDPSDLFGRSKREFDFIEEEFGVLPPAKHVEVEQEDVGGWDREEFATAAPEPDEEAVSHEHSDPWLSAAPKPETVSVVALREAMDFLGIQEDFITEKLIELAKRLS